MGWFLFGLSIPIFYIYGIVQFIRYLIRRNNTPPLAPTQQDSRKHYLKTALQEFATILTIDPKRTIAELAKEYRKQLDGLDRQEKKEPAILSQETISVHQLERTNEKRVLPRESKPIEFDWANWYNDNSINLLLYVGAFLIVASASIFVGFQWESIAGSSKAILISLLTLSFLGLGGWFYTLPKIKQAGLTFIGIGALLIPLVGAAWYNFVFVYQGYDVGTIWLITSLIALATYIVLSFVLTTRFYTYIAALSSISTAFSFVHIAHLPRNFYILAAIISSLILLLCRLSLPKHDKKTTELYLVPLDISSNILLPITLVYGLLIATSQNILATPEVSLSLLLAAVYYGVSYFFLNRSWNVAAAEIFYPLSLLSLFLWQQSQPHFILYVMDGLAFADFGFAYLFKKYNREEAATISILMASVKLIFVFLFSISLPLAPLHQTLLAFIPCLAGYVLAKLKNSPHFYGISSFFLSIGIFQFDTSYLQFALHPEVLGALYCLTGIGHYVLLIAYKEKEAHKNTFSLATVFFFILSIFFATSSSVFLAWICLTIAVVLLSSSWIFQLSYGIPLSAVFQALALVQFFNTYLSKNHTIDLLGITFLGIGCLYYYLTVSYKKYPKWQPSLALATCLFLFLSLCFCLSTPTTLAFVLLVIAGIVTMAVYQFALPVLFPLSAFFSAWCLYLLYHDILHQFDFANLSLIYLGAGAIFYVLTLIHKEQKPWRDYAALSATGFFALSIILVAATPSYLSFVSLCVSGILISVAFLFEQPSTLYGANGFIVFALLNFLWATNLPYHFYPLFFSALSYLYYLIHTQLPPAYARIYRRSALIESLSTPLFFGLTTYGDTYGQLAIEQHRMALVSSYASTVLLTFDALQQKSSQMGYIASAMGILTYLWQVNFIGISQLQAYTIPLGTYFMILGYLRRKHTEDQTSTLFSIVGMLILFGSSFLQSLNFDGSLYALLLGAEGTVFLAFGITFPDKTWRNAGIAAIVVAVISQTYNYLFSLPRWAITGLAGILFLAVATYLLMRRKET